jgi:hypothetical protein
MEKVKVLAIPCQHWSYSILSETNTIELLVDFF